jgi:hypothetical protein
MTMHYPRTGQLFRVDNILNHDTIRGHFTARVAVNATGGAATAWLGCAPLEHFTQQNARHESWSWACDLDAAGAHNGPQYLQRLRCATRRPHPEHRPSHGAGDSARLCAGWAGT